MTDLMFVAGQALSISGLAYGWFLVLTYSGHAGASRTSGESTASLHHVAMA